MNPSLNTECSAQWRLVEDLLRVHLGCPASIGEVSSSTCVRDVMADFRLSADELRPIVQEVVRVVIDELTNLDHLVNGKLALNEEQAADLLGLNPWQLRDLRLAEKIGYTRIVGNRVRYTLSDLHGYLRRHHVPGKDLGR